MISMRLWKFMERNWETLPCRYCPTIGWYHNLEYNGPEWTYPYHGELPKEAYETPIDHHCHSFGIIPEL